VTARERAAASALKAVRLLGDFLKLSVRLRHQLRNIGTLGTRLGNRLLEGGGALFQLGGGVLEFPCVVRQAFNHVPGQGSARQPAGMFGALAVGAGMVEEKDGCL
jgi:hypothetical protein